MNKLLTSLSRFLVGGLFIFSGFIKANDPLGFSYKLEEYFEKFSEIFTEWGLGILAYPMDFFAYIALPLSIIIVVSEVVLGVLTITGSYLKKVAWMLLIMIVFFTILTFVSWFFGLVKSCGCFGDAIPLTPFESFIKDIILLILIIIIFINRKQIKPIFFSANKIITWSSIIVAFLFTWYCYKHLPIKDFRAYAPGKSLLPQMEPTKGNPLTLYKLKHKSNGVEVAFSDYPKDYKNWDYIENNSIDGELKVYEVEIQSTGQITKVLDIPEEFKEDWKVIKSYTEEFKPDEDPKIMQLSANDFSTDEDHLMEMLNDSSAYFWLIIRDLNELGNFEAFNNGLKFSPNKFGTNTLEEISALRSEAKKSNIKFYALCSEANPQKVKSFRLEMDLDFTFYSCDDTELKTMIRSSPGLMLLKSDKVLGKWHHNDIPKFEKVKSKYFKQ